MHVRPLLILFVTLLAPCFVLSCAPPGRSGTSVQVGGAAPELSLMTIEHQQVKLSSLRGNVVVLDFWATWCPPCQRSLPHLNKLSQDARLAEGGLKIIAVNFGESQAMAMKYCEEKQLSLSIAVDEDGSAAREFGIRGLPTTIVIGRDGAIKNIFTSYEGPASDKELDAAIENALAGPAR